MMQESAYNYPLYRAFRKYGIKNFSISIVEDIQDNSLLDEREKYWIEFYDTYKNGYNATLGGSGVTKYNHKEICDYYLKVRDVQEVCKKFSCNRSTVFNILGSNGIYNHFDHEELANSYLKYKNTKKVAELYGCNAETVRIACRERKIPFFSPNTPKTFEEKKNIYETFLKTNNKSETARRCNCSLNLVYKTIKLFEEENKNYE